MTVYSLNPRVHLTWVVCIGRDRCSTVDVCVLEGELGGDRRCASVRPCSRNSGHGWCAGVVPRHLTRYGAKLRDGGRTEPCRQVIPNTAITRQREKVKKREASNGKSVQALKSKGGMIFPKTIAVISIKKVIIIILITEPKTEKGIVDQKKS